MTEVMIPPWVRPESPETIRIIDDAGVAFPPAFGRGMTQRGIFADPRWGLRRRYRGLRSDEKAAILTVLNERRGQFNTIRVTPHTPLRGTFPSSEILTNGTFASGTTGWTAFSPTSSISSSDRRLRVLRILNNASNGCAVSNTATVAVTQYMPHVARAFVIPGRNFASMMPAISVAGVSTEASLASSSFGMLAVPVVPKAGSGYTVQVSDNVATGVQAGDYYEVPYISLARCMLVDNAPNELQFADQIDNAAWTKTATTVSANGTAPDGNATADAVIENTANSQHLITQSSTRASQAEHLCVSGYFKRGTGTRDIRLHVGSSGANYSHATFNLGAGTVGSVTNFGTATLGRAFIVDAGGGFYFCALIMFAAASTSLFTQFDLNNGGSDSYVGDGTSSIYCWGVCASRSGVPSRSAHNTSAVPTGTTQTGSALYVKGLPASTSGLLEVGDWFEWAGELKQATARLSSDAAGLGYLQFRPGLAGSPADGDPIIVNEPFGRFIYPQGVSELENLFGIYADCEMNMEEVYS